MKYILLNLAYQGSPIPNSDGSFTQSANILIGIEGDKYGFTQMQMVQASFTPADTVASIQATIQAAANAFIDNYNS